MIDMMNGDKKLVLEPTLDFHSLNQKNTMDHLVDFEHIIGQQFAKRALEIAAA